MSALRPDVLLALIHDLQDEILHLRDLLQKQQQEINTLKAEAEKEKSDT